MLKKFKILYLKNYNNMKKIKSCGNKVMYFSFILHALLTWWEGSTLNKTENFDLSCITSLSHNIEFYTSVNFIENKINNFWYRTN